MKINRASSRRCFRLARANHHPEGSFSGGKKLNRPVKLGLINDLHQDVMHDGLHRLESFISAMKLENRMSSSR